jgi:hypothetical protein
MTILWFALGALVSGAIGALIAGRKNRGRVEGFAAGLLLGVIGIGIMALIPPKPPKPSKGRYAVRCPYCNAAQNLTNADNAYRCWRCDQSTIAHSLDDANTVGCPACEKKTKVKADTIGYTCSCGERNNLANEL